jgi:carboxylesterase
MCGAPLADYLARRGLAVSVPRIAGHGTTVQDLDTTGPGDWLGTAEQALADLRSPPLLLYVASTRRCHGE